MAITLVGTATAEGSDPVFGSSAVAGAASGDIAIALFSSNTAAGFSTPTDWTEQYAFTDAGKEFVCYARTLASSDTSCDPTGSPGTGLLAVFTGGGALTLGTFETDQNSTGEPDPPSNALTGEGDFVVITGNCEDDDYSTTTAPTGYTLADAVGNSFSSCMLAYQSGVTGTDDPGTFDGTSTVWAAGTVRIDEDTAYTAELSSASFSFAPQSLDRELVYTAELSAPVFGFTAQSLGHSLDNINELTTTLFQTEGQDLEWTFEKVQVLSAPTFSFTAQALGRELVASYELTTASFSFEGGTAVVQVTVLGTGFFQSRHNPAGDSTDGASFFNTHTSNSGDKAGFYGS